MKVPYFWCPKERKRGFHTELDVKMVLATRVDHGEKRSYPCYAGGKKHFHLTSQEKRNVA